MNSIRHYIPPRPDSDDWESRDFLSSLSDAYAFSVEQSDLARIRNSFASLSEDDKEWVRLVHEKLDIGKNLTVSVSEGVKTNTEFLQNVVSGSLRNVVENERGSEKGGWSVGALAARARALPLIAAREWSAYLSVEREETNQAIKVAVKKYFQVENGPILVPGSSAGRLVYELADMGYDVTGIEHDAVRVMLMDSIIRGRKKYTIKPFILETCNRLKDSDNQAEIEVPDTSSISPSTLSRISIDCNEFFETIQTYQGESFSGIVTSWFLDSPNFDMADVVKELKRVLKKQGGGQYGGYWVNVGPLDYTPHAEKNFRTEKICKKYSKIEMFDLLKANGFEIVEEREIESSYMHNPKSIMKSVFSCVFFVAKLVG